MKKVMKRKSIGFTLIELLIVVAIIAVLLLLTLPSFLDIGRGSKMAAAASQLQATINLARQWAITHREVVYIVFPDDYRQMYSGVSTSEYSKALRSYAVYSPAKGYISEWKYLPPGIFFVDTQNPDNQDKWQADSRVNPRKNIFSSNTTERIQFPKNSPPVNTPQVNSLEIKPNGSLGQYSVYNAEIYLVEAFPNDSRGSRIVTLTFKDNPVLRGISINPFTGIPVGIDYTQLAP